MVIVGKIEKMGAGADSTAFGVKSAEIDMPDMGLDDGAGAHIAGLQRDVEIAVENVPGGELSTGFGDRDHLGMKRGILFRLTEIMAAGNDFAVFYDYAADGRFAKIVRFLGFFQRRAHE